jgi:hypothetical protein
MGVINRRALGINTGFEATRDPGDNLAVNLIAYAQYLVGSHGYYRVTYRPVTILAPVNQPSAGGLPSLGGTKGYDDAQRT